MPHPDSPAGRTFCWQSELLCIKQGEREDVTRQIKELESSLAKQSQEFRNNLPDASLRDTYERRIGELSTLPGSSNAIAYFNRAGTKVNALLQQLQVLVYWFDLNARELSSGNELGSLLSKGNLILERGTKDQKTELLGQTRDTAEDVFKLATENVRKLLAEAKRTGKNEDLIEKWKTRILRDIFHGVSASEESLDSPPPPPPKAPGSGSAPTPIGPVIQLPQPLVLVHKSYIPAVNTSRTQVTLTVTDPGGFDGSSGTFSVTSPAAKVKFFDAATGGKLVTTAGRDFTADELNSGVNLFAEGETPSNAMNDIVLKLSLTGGSRPILPPVTANMTSIELTLDIHESRTAAGTDPVALSTAAKMSPGRYVHAQNASFHHGRALLIVRKAVPKAFGGNLELRAFQGNVRLFNDPDEVAAAGQAAVGLPLTIPNGPIPGAGQRFWTEGSGVSGALTDTGFKLGVAGLGQDGDWARMTVVQFSHLSARIRATPPHTPRPGNASAHHDFILAGTQPRDFDEDFAVRVPLVLIRDSLDAAHPIALSVVVTPAGAPVMWSVDRAVKPSSADPTDHADVVAITGVDPTLKPLGSVTLNVTLLPDSVGSFHVRAFIDCNGTNKFERHDGAGARIDREPFILMNLALVQVTLAANNSLTTPANMVGAARAGGGINVSGGVFNFPPPEVAAIHMNATIQVVGGGPNGKVGLLQVFAGWVNNEVHTEDIVGTYVAPPPAPPAPPAAPVVRTHNSVFATNAGAATGNHPIGGAAFLPGDPAPALAVPPLLDSGRPAAGTGGDTATLRSSRTRGRRDLTPDPGQRWIVEAIDAPGDGDPATHLGFPAAQLTRFRFGLQFGAALCIWTNFSQSSGSTNNSAERLYSVVLRYRWTMHGTWTIVPATGVVTPVAVPTVVISAINISSPSVPVAGTDIEVRAPTGLALLARDCRA